MQYLILYKAGDYIFRELDVSPSVYTSLLPHLKAFPARTFVVQTTLAALNFHPAHSNSHYSISNNSSIRIKGATSLNGWYSKRATSSSRYQTEVFLQSAVSLSFGFQTKKLRFQISDFSFVYVFFMPFSGDAALTLYSPAAIAPDGLLAFSKIIGRSGTCRIYEGLFANQRSIISNLINPVEIKFHSQDGTESGSIITDSAGESGAVSTLTGLGMQINSQDTTASQVFSDLVYDVVTDILIDTITGVVF